MIYLYSGTPGSGKSLHTAKDIVSKLRRGHRVIANFPVNESVIRSTFLKKLFTWIITLLHLKIDLNGKFERQIGTFVYKDNPELTVKFLVKFAKENHVRNKEGQTLLIIDECSVMFNPREFTRKDRNSWIKFFQHHRKFGYNVILISQNDRLIDRQIRSFIEYDVKHRKANNFGSIGMLFTLVGVKLFVAVSYWYGVHEKCGAEFFTYKKQYSRIYDSFAMFDEEMVDIDIEEESNNVKKPKSA